MSIKLMTVDDSSTTRGIFKKVLPRLFVDEVDVYEAEDAEEGLHILEDNPDMNIIFLDLNMPEMNGDEFLDIVRFKPQYSDDVKIIMASTEGNEEKISELIFSGADGYIQKPITLTNLTQAVMPIARELGLELLTENEEKQEELKETVQQNEKVDKLDKQLAQLKDNISEYKILTVDDSSTIRKMFKKHLPPLFKTPTNIISAENGKDALDVLKEHPDVKLIFLDVNMPVMDGYKFLQTMRLMPQYKDITVIMATTEGGNEMVTKFLKAGANGYLIKPFTIDSINKVLKRIKRDVGGFMLIESEVVEKVKTKQEENVFKFLIIDNDKVVNRMFSKQLPAMFKDDVEVLCAENAKDGIKLLAKNADTSMIFVDSTMPDSSVMSVIRTIKVMPELKHIKIVLLADDENIENIQQFISQGISGYIVKPLTVFGIKQVIFPIVEDELNEFDIFYDHEEIGVGNHLDIMTVDDSKIIRTMFKKSLPMMFKNKLNIIEAENGKIAIEKLKQNKNTKIMFLDMNMPEMDGRTCLKTVRMIPEYKDMRIIMVTSEQDIELRQELTVEGADGYIIKADITIDGIRKCLMDLTKELEGVKFL
jgi:CheY-like chemotaxis protein